MTLINPANSLILPGQQSATGFGSAAGQAVFPNFAGTPASGTASANTIHLVQADVPWARVFTGIGYYVGATSSGNVQCALYDSSGNRVAIGTSTAQGGANVLQKLPFTATYSAKAGTYILALAIDNGTGTWMAFGWYFTPAGAPGSSFPPPATVTPPTFQTFPPLGPIVGLFLY